MILVPGEGACSGTLIDDDVVLTAGHCTDFFDQAGFETVLVTFDSEAAVDKETWLPVEGEGTWYAASGWATHPDYVEADWPFTYDYGVVLLAPGELGDTILAVHTGGYNLGFDGQICGRITSLNHRVDDPDVLAWISEFLD